MILSTNLFSQETVQTVEDYLSKCQYQQAIDYLVQKNDTSKEADMQKVLCYNYLHNYPKAIEVLLSLQEKDSADVQVKIQLASAYNNLSMLPESIKYFDELIKADSTNAYFKIRKADLLYQSNKYDQALDEYKQAFVDDNSSYLPKQIASCFEKVQQWDSAKIYFNRALQIDSTDEKSKIELVKTDINQENYAAALYRSEEFLLKDTNNIQLNILKSFCFYQLNDYTNAIANFERCRSLGDTSLLVNKYLGFSYFFSDSDEKANPYLIQAFNQDTTNNSVLYALASVNQTLENFPEAIRLYEKLIQKAVPSNNILYMYYKKLADSYHKNNDYQPAIDNYKKALMYFSGFQNMDLLFNIADLYDVYLHDYEMSIGYYRQYRESLNDYMQFLVKSDSTNEREIGNVSDRLKSLDEQINYVEGKIKK
jgi:tetratricopeptide (TPR) repeat protein